MELQRLHALNAPLREIGIPIGSDVVHHESNDANDGDHNHALRKH
jgi:hypothetical protein